MPDKKKTALGNPPKKSAQPKQAEGLTRLSPGIYRNRKGEIVDSKGQRINRSGQPRKDVTKDKKKKDAAPKDEAPETPFREQTTEGQVGEVHTETGVNIMDLLKQMQAQGAFNPGDYDQSYQEAAQNVMDQFEAQNAQQFQLESEAAEEAIAQRGIDPAGRQAERLRAQLAQNQGGLRRQAQLAAEQAGRTVQQQRFEQDLVQYNVPSDQISKLGSLFSGQLVGLEAQKQRDFEAEQNRLTREQQLQVSRMNQGGNADPFALMQAEYGLKRDLLYDQAALAGQQGGGGGAGAAALAGFGQGFGAGLGSSLGRR